MKKIVDFFVVRPILKFKKFKPAESIVIFSEARGGSTWLMEMLSEVLDVSINYEPLHVQKGVIPKKLKFGWRPFVPKENTDDYIRAIFKKIHAFDAHTKWTRKYVRPKTLLNSKHVLIKYVRANMLLPFLLENFNFKYAPIFLLRHPIDVCMSQVKAFGVSGQNSFDVQATNTINNDRFLEYKDYINSLNTHLEKKIAIWCLNNCYAIDHLNDFNIEVVFYSDLLLSPKEELERIIKSYGLYHHLEKLDEIDFRRASATDYNNDYQKNVENQLNKNFEELDENTKERIQRIFDHFDFKLYSAFSPHPNKKLLKVA